MIELLNNIMKALETQLEIIVIYLRVFLKESLRFHTSKTITKIKWRKFLANTKKLWGIKDSV